MKLYLIGAILMISLLSFQEKGNDIVVIGKITGEIPLKVDYSVPVNGISYVGFSETAKTDSLGNFQLKMKVEKPAFVLLKLSEKLSAYLIVEPGGVYNVKVIMEKGSNSFKVSGPNENGQDLYNTFPRPFLVQIEAKKFLKDTSFISVKEKIAELKSNDLLKLKALLEKNEISRTFYELVEKDRSCYYSSLTAVIPYIRFMQSMQIHPGQSTVSIKQNWEDIYSDNPVSQNSLMISPYWFEYAQNYLHFKEYTQKDFSVPKLKEYYGSGAINTHNISEAKKYLPPTMLEYYEAAYLYFECSQKKYEKEFISIFQQFNNDYPKSKFAGYLKPLIDPIVEFHKVAEKDFGQNMRFIDNDQKFNSLKEALHPFEGKKVYIDVWATWCGPCKAEFEHKDNLYKVLKSNGIEILYISIDEDRNDQQWKNMIKYYKLEGSHIRANHQLIADLRRIYNQNGLIAIPWYLLIDEHGNVIRDHAKKPSQIEALKKEIDEIQPNDSSPSYRVIRP